jgi:hypothetical protein
MRIQKHLALALTVPAFALSACYVIPIGTDGFPGMPAGTAWGPGVSQPGQPIVPVGARPPVPPQPQQAPQQQPRPASPPAPATLQARFYPANEIAAQTGIVSGTVTNMMSGKGRFLLDYEGELLSGEATRVSGDERKGVASAYSKSGSYMSCEYQMNTPFQGAGTCAFSNGARYQVHIGN